MEETGEKPDSTITLDIDSTDARTALVELAGTLESWDDNPEAAIQKAMIPIQAMQDSNAKLPKEQLKRERVTIAFDGSKEPKERAEELVEALTAALAPDEE